MQDYLQQDHSANQQTQSDQKQTKPGNLKKRPIAGQGVAGYVSKEGRKGVIQSKQGQKPPIRAKQSPIASKQRLVQRKDSLNSGREVVQRQKTDPVVQDKWDELPLLDDDEEKGVDPGKIGESQGTGPAINSFSKVPGLQQQDKKQMQENFKKRVLGRFMKQAILPTNSFYQQIVLNDYLLVKGYAKAFLAIFKLKGEIDQGKPIDNDQAKASLEHIIQVIQPVLAYCSQTPDTKAKLQGVTRTFLSEFEVVCGTFGVDCTVRDHLLAFEANAGAQLSRSDSTSFGPGSNFSAENSSKNQLLQEIDQLKGSDVKQGNLGLCYMYAALASLAELNASLVRSMFVGVEDTQATIRLFTSKGKPVYIKIERTAVENPTFSDNAQNPEWVRLIAKAYVVAGFTGQEGEEVKDANIGQHLDAKGMKTADFGNPAVAMGHLTGVQQPAMVTGNKALKNDTFENIKQALTEGKVVTCKFENSSNQTLWNMFFSNTYKVENPASLIAQHIYTIMGHSNNQLLIRNPWGRYTPLQQDDQPIAQGGTNFDQADASRTSEGNFYISKEDFQKHGSHVMVHGF